MPIRSAVAAYLSFALLAACTGQVEEGRVSASFDVPAGAKRLHVVIPAGSITALPSDDGRIHYEAATARIATERADLDALAAVAIELRLEGPTDGELRLVGPALPEAIAARDPGAALVMKIALRAPPTLDLELHTGRGPVGARRWPGAIDLRTDSGDIVLEDVHGVAHAFTGAGNYVVTGHRGALDLETRHGDFLVYVDEIGADGLRLRTHAGSMQCNLPENPRCTLIAETALGEVETRLPVERVPSPHGVRATATLGGGGPDVMLHADVGNISVRSKQR